MIERIGIELLVGLGAFLLTFGLFLRLKKSSTFGAIVKAAEPEPELDTDEEVLLSFEQASQAVDDRIADNETDVAKQVARTERLKRLRTVSNDED